MNQLKHVFWIFTLCAFIGCSEDDPDPIAIFEGTYEMNDFDVTIETGNEDTTMTVSSPSDVEFEQDEDLDGDELIMEVDDFLEDLIEQTVGQLTTGFSYGLEFDDDILVRVAGSEFEMDDTNFILTETDDSDGDQYEALCELEGEGSKSGEDLELEFEITLFLTGEDSYVFTGTVSGERDQ